MNILFIGFSVKNNAGGIERYTSTILKGYKARGHNIYVYVLDNPAPHDRNNDFVYISDFIKRDTLADKVLFELRFRRYVRRNGLRFDLVLNGHIFITSLSERIAKVLGMPYSLFVYGIDAWGTRFSDWSKKMTRLKSVISISSFTTSQVRAQGYKGRVIYFPPLLENTSAVDLLAGNLKEKDKTILLTVARLDQNEQYKGHDAVIKALAMLKGEFTNLEYWIVGKGNDMPRLQKLAAECGVESIVRFFGFVSDEDLQTIYCKTHIFIMPSRVSLDPAKLEGEGFGIVFTEAALYENALIGPVTGGSTDIITDKVNGLTCDPLDFAQLADLIRHLVRDPAYRARLGENAKNNVLANFTMQQFDKYAKELLE